MKDPASLPLHDQPTHSVLVYDQHTGKVLHVHDFITEPGADGWTTDEMKRIALEAARGRGEPSRMAAIEVPASLRISGDTVLVDVAARKLSADPTRETPESRMRAS